MPLSPLPPLFPTYYGNWSFFVFWISLFLTNLVLNVFWKKAATKCERLQHAQSSVCISLSCRTGTWAPVTLQNQVHWALAYPLAGLIQKCSVQMWDAACTWEEMHLEAINAFLMSFWFGFGFVCCFILFPQLRGALRAPPILTAVVGAGQGDGCGWRHIRCTQRRIWEPQMSDYCREVHLILHVGMKLCPYHHATLISKVQTSGKMCLGCILNDGFHSLWMVWEVESSPNHPTERALLVLWFLVVTTSICIQGNKFLFPHEAGSARVFCLKMSRVPEWIPLSVWDCGKANLPQALKCDILKLCILN